MKLTIQTQIKRSLALTLALGLFGLSSLMMLEPALTNAQSDTDDIVVTQTVVSGISITAGADIALRDLNTLTSQNTAVGSTSINVITNNDQGYTLAVSDDSTPAFARTTGTEAFADFDNGGGTTPATWTVTNDYQFGFSASGDDIDAAYDSGTNSPCAPTATPQDPNSSVLNWDGFNGATDITIATTATVTPAGGTDATFCVASEQAGTNAPAGDYATTITATATVN